MSTPDGDVSKTAIPADGAGPGSPLAETAAPHDPNAKHGRRIREYQVLVEDVVFETSDTVTLYFELNGTSFDYRAGQFLTIDPHQFPALAGYISYLEHRKGKREPPRAYSLTSSPHEQCLAITVKEEGFVPGVTAFPPLLSPFLVRCLHPGMHLVVSGFTGPYVLPPNVEHRSERIVHLCAGSGIVPNFSLIKYCLREHPRLKHTLVYSNKTWDDIIFRDQLLELERQYPDRLHIIHALTRDPSISSRGDRVRGGRVHAGLIREFVPELEAVEVFCCGPGLSKWDKQAAASRNEAPAPRFLESALAALKELGVPHERIHHESYG